MTRWTKPYIKPTWDAMQRHWDEDAKAREDVPPRAPAVEFRWFRHDGGKWHCIERFEGECLVSACGNFLRSGYAELSSSPPVQQSCLSCLRRLSKLPPGTYTDDALPAKAEQTARAWLGGTLPAYKEGRRC